MKCHSRRAKRDRESGRWVQLPLDSRSRGNDSLLALRRIERRLHVARLILLREQDDAVSGVLELLEIVALQSAELHHQNARLRPFAVTAELDLADDRIELVRPNMIGELRIVEGTNRLHRRLQNLHLGIGVYRNIEAERIDARRDGALAILLQEF